MVTSRQNYKIIIIGESFVGKTSIMQRYVNDIFEDNLLATIGIDLLRKTVRIGDEEIDLDIWDTAGQERFHSITKSYYRGANGIFLVFDFSEQKTFESLDQWFSAFENEVSQDVPIFLIGNKYDLIEDMSTSMTPYEEKSNQKNIKFFPVSASTGYNIEKIFIEMALECKKSYRPQDYDVGSVVFVEENKKKKKKRCC